MGLRLPLRVARVRPCVEELESRLTPAVTIRFDYSYDTSGFFADAGRRAVLEKAAHSITDRIGDDLQAVAAGGGNSWQANVFNPATNSTITLDNLLVREDELVVYIGAADLDGAELGLTTTGGFNASGSRSWLSAVRTRGQAGTAAGGPKTDFSTWGGMITFDTDVNWSFSTTAAPAADQFDFESVAAHELLHVFGFGIGEPAFARNVAGWNGSSGQFVGPAVTALTGGPVGVVGAAGVPDHWAPGTAFQGKLSPVSAEIPAGVKRTVTELDLAALKDVGWEIGIGTPVTVTTPAPVAVSAPPAVASSFAVAATAPVVAAPPVVVPPPASPAPIGVARFAIGTPVGAVAVDGGGRSVATVAPFAPGIGAVRVAVADLTADGRPDTVVGTGAGVPNRVAVVTAGGAKVVDFQPFEPAFTGGVFLATGDLTGDGTPDLVVTPDQGGGPAVAVYDGAALARGQVAQVSRFWGIADAAFRGGARPAVGDLNGDGRPDLVIAAGSGGGPRVSLYDGRSFAAGVLAHLGPDFFAFESGLRNGVFPAVADVNGDEVGDLICGAGPGGGPRVTAFSGRELAAGRVTVAADFFAGDATSRGGVRLAVTDLNGDGRPDVVAASGTGNQALVYPADRLGRSGPALVVGVPVDAPDGLFVG